MTTTGVSPATTAGLGAGSDWSTVAAGWDARRDFVEATKAELTEELFAGLALAPGERVLELGAGTGELALRLAEAVRPGGHVHATDVAGGMVELIRATTKAAPDIDADRVDAADLQLPAASYDAVVFRMGLMFLLHPGDALREIHRVLKPGGRLGVTTWGAVERNPWLTCIGMAAMMNGLVHSGPPTGPAGVLSLTDAAELERLAREAGFADARVTEVDVTFRYDSVEQHVETTGSLAPPIAAAFAAASPEQMAAVRKTAGDLSAQYATDDGLVIPGRALLLLATR